MEIETDKTTVGVPSPAHGIIEEIFVADGDTVKSGQQLFKLKVTGEAPAIKPAAAPKVEAPMAAAPPPPPTPKPTVRFRKLNPFISFSIYLFFSGASTSATACSSFFCSAATSSETYGTYGNGSYSCNPTCTSYRRCYC